MALKLYVDFLSQPCRALYITLKINNIPFTPVQVHLTKGEHLKKEFKENVTRFSKLPVLSDDGFNLVESVAILRYLANTGKLSDNWYSKDPKKQARIDEYLEWQHNNTRQFCASYFQQKYLLPLMGKTVSPETVASHKKDMESTLDKLQKLWLTPGPYINSDHLTAADIWAACELEQLKIADYNPETGRDKLKGWIEKVKNETNPYYDEAHRLVYKIKERQNQAK